MMSSRTKLYLSAAWLLVATLAYAGMYRPLSQPVSRIYARGKVVGKRFEPAHTTGSYQGPRHANPQVTVLDRYLVEVRLDSGELVRGVLPATPIETLPVGQDVTVAYERRTLFFLWARTNAVEIIPVSN